MTAAIHAIDRDRRGRFQPGCSGNPAGKAPGTLNRATVMKRLLDEGDEIAFARAVLDKARDGEWAALRFVMERLEPKMRQRGIPFGFTEGTSVLEMSEITLGAMGAGEISPDEANQVARFIDWIAKRRADAKAEAAADLQSSCTQQASPVPAGAGDGRSTPGAAKPQPLPAMETDIGRRPAPAQPPVAAAPPAPAGTGQGALHSSSNSPRLARRRARAAAAADHPPAHLPLAAAASASALHSACIAG